MKNVLQSYTCTCPFAVSLVLLCACVIHLLTMTTYNMPLFSNNEILKPSIITKLFARIISVMNFPFKILYRIQPNLETRKKQLEAWCSLVLSYQRHTKKYSLDVTEAQNSPLFHNKSINSILISVLNNNI